MEQFVSVFARIVWGASVYLVLIKALVVLGVVEVVVRGRGGRGGRGGGGVLSWNAQDWGTLKIPVC